MRRKQDKKGNYQMLRLFDSLLGIFSFYFAKLLYYLFVK